MVLIRWGLLIGMMILLAIPTASSAIDVRGNSRTYLQFRETAGDDSLYPLFEYLDFSLNDFGRKDLLFHFGGWVRQDLNSNDSFDDRSSNSDLQYAYLGFNERIGNRIINLGRVPVYGGVASEIVDGVSAQMDLVGGFGISAYGGLPVESDFDDRSGDRIYGGQLTHKIPNLYTLGLSYLKERNDSVSFRSEAGLDLSLYPVRHVEVYGRSNYNGETSGWMEHAYYMTIGPFANFRINTEFSSTNYEDYFQAVDLKTTSVFSLDPLRGILDAKEKLRLMGGTLEYALGDDTILSANYRNYDYSIADTADYWGLSISHYPTTSTGLGFSVHRMDGNLETREYWEYRAYGYIAQGNADVTIDVFSVIYDEERNDIKTAYNAVLALGYNLTKNARMTADIDYSRTPTFDYDLRGFIKFIYSFDRLPLMGVALKQGTPVKHEEPNTEPLEIQPVPGKEAAVPATPEPKKKVDEKAPEDIIETAPAPLPAVTPQAGSSDPWSLKMKDWRERLESTPENKFTIQVEISGNRNSILKDLNRLLPDYDAMVVPYQAGSWKAYTLIVGLFNSRQDGKLAIRTLPPSFQKIEPLVRNMLTIQKGLIDEAEVKGKLKAVPVPKTGSSLPAPSPAPVVAVPAVIAPVAKTAPKEADKSPEIILIDNIRKVMDGVHFQHWEHQKRVNQDCTVCHHMEEKGARELLPCSNCHGTTEGAPGFKEAMHKKCQGCHKNKATSGRGAPVKCDGCHRSKP